MLFFRFFRLFSASNNNELRLAVRTAVASRHSMELSSLLALHGDRACALVLSDLSGRVIAQALSMLASAERGRIESHLSIDAHDRLHEAEGGSLSHAAFAQRSMMRGPLMSLLL